MNEKKGGGGVVTPLSFLLSSSYRCLPLSRLSSFIKVCYWTETTSYEKERREKKTAQKRKREGHWESERWESTVLWQQQPFHARNNLQSKEVDCYYSHSLSLSLPLSLLTKLYVYCSLPPSFFLSLSLPLSHHCNTPVLLLAPIGPVLVNLF